MQKLRDFKEEQNQYFKSIVLENLKTHEGFCEDDAQKLGIKNVANIIKDLRNDWVRIHEFRNSENRIVYCFDVPEITGQLIKADSIEKLISMNKLTLKDLICSSLLNLDYPILDFNHQKGIISIEIGGFYFLHGSYE